MAFEVNFTISENCNCKQLTFVDTTGTYNVSSNPTGWGTPNPDITDAHYGELEITSPAGVVTIIDVVGTGDFPNGGNTASLVILNTDLGYTEDEKLPDGVWKFKLTYGESSITDVIGSTTVWKMFLCQAKCCVANMFAALPVTECNCDSSKLDNAIFADRMLTALKYAAQRGDTSKFTNLLTLVNNLCSDDCGCGCS